MHAAISTGHDNAGERVWHIDPPPEEMFTSEEAAVAALHAWTMEHGFNLSIRSAHHVVDDDKSTPVWRRYYECDRAGVLKNTGHRTDQERKRLLRGSKCGNCKMQIVPAGCQSS